MNILKALCFGIGIISSNVFSAKPGDVIEVGKYVFRTDLIEKVLGDIG